MDTTRLVGIFNPSTFLHPIHVIGCGGMGSRVAEGLIRMGLGIPDKNPIYLYDKDTFEKHNLTNQWANVSHLSIKKVRAVRSSMLEINPDASITAVTKFVSQKHWSFAGVVFICIDSMQSRRFIVDYLLVDCKSVNCVIETRMDAGVGISHCFNPNNKNHIDCWRLYWYSDKETENMQGCGGAQSVISAIYGTTTLALKQFERFAREGDALGFPNRVYNDFNECHASCESWST
jgi:hypothetical protein